MTAWTQWEMKIVCVPFEAHFQYTKQNLLRKILSVFGPLGFLALYVIRAKVLKQNVWVSGLDWDEELNKEWSGAAVPRFLIPSGERGSFLSHVFTDTLEKVYCAVVYARCV